MAIDYTKRPQPAPPPAQQKVTLTKGSPKVSLTKSGGVGGVARVNLNWSAQSPEPAPQSGGGFLSRVKKAADLDGVRDEILAKGS